MTHGGALQETSTSPVNDEQNATVIAVSTSRVVFGNERALRDALLSLARAGAEIDLICRKEPWNERAKDYLRPAVKRIYELPLCEFPLRGWYLKAAIDFLPRYLASNIALWRIVQAHRRAGSAITLLFGDADAAITFNVTLRLLRVPVIFRCGVLPATHNVLRRSLFFALRTVVQHYVVDSSFMAQRLTAIGVKLDRIVMIRPMPPSRTLSSA
ncbi:MAG: NAD(P)-binding domain-containing protein [Hyphomonadaceae bacterium]|nr:NAD(P)-binding domain-containing protein [Hyphomonadaceae bacterium]MBY0565135.1 NAD(P)-binding domain-containing protein [Hyphomonadaceae bacterium]